MNKVVKAVIAEDKTDRIVYERVGWVENKSALQNRCIELMEQHASRVEYYILAGGDEVYDPADLERLKKEIERLHRPDIPLYEFVHLWKRPDLRAVDSMWDTWMHRCYRNHGKGMRFGHHAGPPAKPDGSQLNPGVKVRGVRVYHYSAMKDKRDIQDRIKFYQQRDGKGKDTWTDWQPGKPTQWTHGGGTAKAYDGPHPPAIAADVWGLVPDMPRPKKCKVFLSGRKADQEKAKDFIVQLSDLCPTTVVGMVNPRWPEVQFRKVRDLKKMLDYFNIPYSNVCKPYGMTEAMPASYLVPEDVAAGLSPNATDKERRRLESVDRARLSLSGSGCPGRGGRGIPGRIPG